MQQSLICVALALCLLASTGVAFVRGLSRQAAYTQTLFATSSSSEPVSTNEVNRRQVGSIAAGFMAVLGASTLGSTRARAGWFSSDEQDRLNEIMNFQKPIYELMEQLRVVDTPNALGMYSKQQASL